MSKETKKAFVVNVGRVTGNVSLHLEGFAVLSKEFGFYSKFYKKPLTIITWFLYIFCTMKWHDSDPIVIWNKKREWWTQKIFWYPFVKGLNYIVLFSLLAFLVLCIFVSEQKAMMSLEEEVLWRRREVGIILLALG